MNAETTPPQRPASQLAVSIAATLAMLAGSLVLLGWAFDVPLLKSLLPGWVSVKPNTAVAFLLIGFALRFYRPLATPQPRLSAALCGLARLCAWLVGLLGFATALEYLTGWNPGFDQWLFPEPAGAIGTSHPGRMAPDTALCFMLLAAAVRLGYTPRRAQGRRFLAALLGALVAIVALAALLTYFTPEVGAYGWGGLTIMAVPTASVFVLLGGTLSWSKWRESTADLPPESAAISGPRVWYAFLLVATLLAAGLVTVSTLVYRNYQRQSRAHAEQELMAVADLKISQIVQWRQERLNDADLLFSTPSIIRRALDTLAQPTNPGTRGNLTASLQPLLGGRAIQQVLLLDEQLQVVLAYPESAPAALAEPIRARAAQAQRTRQVVIADLHRDRDDDEVHLSYLIPLVTRGGTNREVPAAGSKPSPNDRSRGVVILTVNAEQRLYPWLRKWPSASGTAETLLVRRDGNSVVYLNELRHRTNTALRLSLPIAPGTRLPEALAAQGEEGVVDGLDYRGVRVLAGLRKIENSPWFLVAKVDQSELDAPLRRQAWLTGALVLVLLCAAVLGVALLGRQRALGLERAHHESDRKYRALFEQASVGVAQLDSHSGQFLSVNQRYAAMLGYTEEELLHTTFKNHTHPDDLPANLANMERLIAGEIRAFTMEKRYQRKDGALRWVSLTVSPLWAPGETPRHHVAVVQDITERKQAEALAQQEQALGHTLIDAVPGAFYMLDEQGRYVRWNAYQRDEIAGKPEAEMSGISALETIHPDDRALIQERIANVLVHGAVETVEGRVLLRGGPDYIWLLMTGRRVVLHGRPYLVGIGIDLTERKRAETALATERTLLRTLLDLLPSLIYVKDRASRFLMANVACARYMGAASPEALVGRTDAEFYPPEAADQFRRGEEQVLAGTPLVDQEERRELPDGTDQVLLTNKVPLRDHDGNIIGLVGASLEITERKRAEETLRRSEASLQAAQRIAHLGSWELDGTTNRLRWSEETCRIFGLPPDSFDGARDTFLQIVHPEDRAAVRAAYQQSVATRQPYSITHRLLLPDGQIKYVLEHCETLYTPAGQPLRSVGTVQDITERTRAELALREKEARFRTLVENIPQKVFLKDRQSRWLSVNENFARNLGLHPSDMEGKSDYDFFPPELAAKYQADDQRVMTSGQTEELEEPHELKGQKTWVHIIKVPVRNAQGEITGLFGIFWDITARKQNEAKLAEQLAELRGWHRVTLGREGRVVELKQEVNELLAGAGQPLRYADSKPTAPAP
jgi:PAS domain S-box-containing protein